MPQQLQMCRNDSSRNSIRNRNLKPRSWHESFLKGLNFNVANRITKKQGLKNS